MKLKTIPTGVYAANCYIIIDEESKEAAVIDPGGDSNLIINFLNSTNSKLMLILLTHGHFDHTGAAVEISLKYDVPISLHAKDEDFIIEDNELFRMNNFNATSYCHLKDTSIISLGSKIIKCIETPGHSPGGLCYLIEDWLFSGDTLFSGSIGRTDLIGGDYNTLINSIEEKLLILPDNTKVFPGHGFETTIIREKDTNPFLKKI